MDFSLRRAIARLIARAPHRTPQSSEDPDFTSGPADAAPAPDTRPARRARRLPVVLVTTGALVFTGAGVAVAQAHKTVTLDVDGEVSHLGTFSGTVAGLLDSAHVEIAAHDALTPAASEPLTDGLTVVVRHAHRVRVTSNGQTSIVWSTAQSAADALTVLQARGANVSLVTSRSSSGRVELPMRLAVAGTVDVVADGATRTVPAAHDVAAAIAAAGVTVGAADRVQVLTQDGRLTVKVQRVKVSEVSAVTEIPFRTTTRATSRLYTGQRRTVRAGVPGTRTQVFQVTTVDGVEVARAQVSDAVTTAPVDAIVEVGSAARPATRVVASAGGGVWAALARCESGGNPKAVSRNGLYYGLYQFSLPTWRAMGGSGLPTQASAAEQTARAQALQARSGWGQWPVCSVKIGVR